MVTGQSPAAASHPSAGKDRPSRTLRPGRVVGCPIDENTLLIVGLGRLVAGDVPVEFDGEQAETAFVSNWRLATPLPPATHGFAALLTIDHADRSLTKIRFGEGPASARYVFAPRPASIDQAAVLVAESGGAEAAPAIERLVDVLMSGDVSLRKIQAAATLLQTAGASDGFVELIGENQDGATFLQGWCHSMTPGRYRVSLVGNGTPVIAECGIASFPRTDAPDGASGFVGLIDPNEAVRAQDFEGLVFKGRPGWRHLAVHPRRRVVGPMETPEHIRSILLRTQSAPDVLLSLRSAANSFDGKETVSSLPYPVRMGIDDAYEADGGNLLISGWMLDPDERVAAVRLRRLGAAVRLDERWTRLERPDVSDSFSDEQQFTSALRGGHHTHGFVVHAKLPGGDDAATPLYLELMLRDSRRAFLPVKPTRVTSRSAALRQIGSIDPANWALSAIVDTQIVPFLSESGRSAPVVDTVLDTGSFYQDRSPPIVIGAGESEEDISPLLALLALDPETRRAPIVIAMPAERFQRQAACLGELVRFYRLSARLVSVTGTGDAYDLLEAGAQAVSSETIVLLSASLVPHGAGWYGKLVATEKTLRGSIVSPVLAYEDHSIRWAGTFTDDDNSNQPVVGRYAGYPLKAVTGMELTRIAAASLECCIMPRDALIRAGGFSGGYLGAQEKGLDFGLRLSRSGIDAYLLPSVQMWGCDDAPNPDAPAMAALVEEIDRKIFKRQWSPALPLEKPEKRSV
ncbi:hypothetical protein IB238_14000 [Rhizobium sp. ARZ01]|uniref:glycosyltransferase family 2 protein n=1 Tax=Rhizobium sp. ARZ01 TaxID=2769313 RepID=UPI00177BFA3D|nr:hypothetical protein [Rhizobium sp. ARZ01]MBD9373736.1 hypothetical protein [Rhizobium sp. ARZ01]